MLYINIYIRVPRRRSLLKSQYGITLLEFIVILSIIIILTVSAVPLFLDTLKNHRLSSSMESLYYALQYARSEAIKRNTNVYVSFVTGDNWCYGINVGSNCNCATVGSCTLATTSAPQTQTLSLSALGYSSNYVYFEGTHGAANASGSLTMTLYGGSSLIKISIGMLGNLQMCSTGINGYTAC